MSESSEIKKRRTELGLTQRELAKQFHVDQTTISKWEKGLSRPDFETGKKLSQFFGIPLNLIYKGESIVDRTYLPIYQNLRPSHFDENTFDSKSYIDVGKSLYSCVSPRLTFREDEDHTDIAEDFFAFLVPNDEMKPFCFKEDVVFVQKNAEIHPGDFIVASLDNREAEVSRVNFHPSGVSLSFTGSGRIEFRTTSQFNAGEIKILGRVAKLERTFP